MAFLHLALFKCNAFKRGLLRPCESIDLESVDGAYPFPICMHLRAIISRMTGYVKPSHPRIIQVHSCEYYADRHLFIHFVCDFAFRNPEQWTLVKHYSISCFRALLFFINVRLHGGEKMLENYTCCGSCSYFEG